MLSSNICHNKAIPVTVLESHKGKVVVEQALECSNCKSSCLLAQKKKSFSIYTNKSYTPGSTINIIIDERYALKLALLLYGLPIVLMIVFAAVADILFQKESVTAFTALSSLIISWTFLKYVSKNLKKSPVYILD